MIRPHLLLIGEAVFTPISPSRMIDLAESEIVNDGVL